MLAAPTVADLESLLPSIPPSLQSLRIQHRSLALATLNLTHHLSVLSSTYETALVPFAVAELEKERKLLREYDVWMYVVGKVKVSDKVLGGKKATSTAGASERTLGSYISRDKMGLVKDKAEAAFGELPCSSFRARQGHPKLIVIIILPYCSRARGSIRRSQVLHRRSSWRIRGSPVCDRRVHVRPLCPSTVSTGVLLNSRCSGPGSTYSCEEAEECGKVAERALDRARQVGKDMAAGGFGQSGSTRSILYSTQTDLPSFHPSSRRGRDTW